MDLKDKRSIFLAGDSTMQAYNQSNRPQYGWGEVLYKYIDDNLIKEYHRENSVFGQQKAFEVSEYIIDNCAMAGRSTKSFTDEKRHLDIFDNIKEKDLLIMEFGHNDISEDKPERYVPVEKLKDYFNIFINEAKEKGFKLIILSPILIDVYSNDEAKLKAVVDNLKVYIKEIETIAKNNNLPFVNVGELAINKLENNFDNISELYLEDHVHLNEKGANFFAEIIGEKIVDFLK